MIVDQLDQTMNDCVGINSDSSVDSIEENELMTILDDMSSNFFQAQQIVKKCQI